MSRSIWLKSRDYHESEIEAEIEKWLRFVRFLHSRFDIRIDETLLGRTVIVNHYIGRICMVNILNPYLMVLEVPDRKRKVSGMRDIVNELQDQVHRWGKAY